MLGLLLPAGAFVASVTGDASAVPSLPVVNGLLLGATTPTSPDPGVPRSGSLAAPTVGPAVVNPRAYYSAQPAPMGFADFGVGQGGAAYTYNTTEFLANFSWRGLNFSGPQSHSLTVQLNVVLEFTNSGTSYSYWIQDVAILNSSSMELTFEDNIWNFSSSATCLSNSALAGNGTVYPFGSSGCVGYYAVGAFGQPGADRTMSSPGSFSMEVRSYRAAGGRPEVAFEYQDGVTSYLVTYDNVVWPWATGVSSDPGFMVDGTQYTPNGLYYDAEVTLGGPGGGSSTAAENPTNSSLRLFYWNGHNFQAPRSAWNFGSNTGETVSNIQSIWLNAYTAAADGTPLLVQLNGTAFDAGLDQVYVQSSVGYLNVSAAGVTKGTVAVGATDWEFTGGLANITLTPGIYHVWENSSKGAVDLGFCSISAGLTTSVVSGVGCTPAASTPLATPASLDLGQRTTLRTQLLSAGSGGDTFSWNITPAGLGCGASTSNNTTCTPTTAGIYLVKVTVRDSVGATMTTSASAVVVYVDPTVRLSASRGHLDVGQTLILTATPSAGSGAFAIVWAGLPPGCVGNSSASQTCRPAGAGSFQVDVTATDSDGWPASGTVNITVFPDPSIVTFLASPGSILEGSSVLLQVTPTGGEVPLTFSYTGLPKSCASANTSSLACSTSDVGSYTVVVTITDASGAQANSTVTFTVLPTFLGLPAEEGYALLAAVVLALGIAGATAAILLRRRRDRRRGGP